MSYFWQEAPRHQDLERHLAEREKLAQAIAETDGKNDALNRLYRRMRYELGASLAQLQRGKK